MRGDGYLVRSGRPCSVCDSIDNAYSDKDCDSLQIRVTAALLKRTVEFAAVGRGVGG